MKRVRATLTTLPDVAAVDIDFAAKTATITANSDKTISRQAVETALKSAGYGVTTFSQVAAEPGAAGS